MYMLSINPGTVVGLAPDDQVRLAKLLDVFNNHSAKNEQKNRYYEGKISLSEVNLGIALPVTMRNLEIGCAWGAKAVDVLASRSMFDGFVGQDGMADDELTQITVDNRLIAEYQKACRDELKYGVTFATLSARSARDRARVKIRWHSAQTAAAIWSGEKCRIDYGMAIIDTAPDGSDSLAWSPSRVNMYTDTDVIVLEREGDMWSAYYMPHRMGRPLMEPMIYDATSQKPFGRSRIKEPVRRLIQGYVRTIANATIGLEFATSPQKYILGVTDEQYDVLITQKFKQYVGSIIAATANPDTGEKPSFGQLQQGSLTPHVEMLRVLATQFSAATGLSIMDTGVVNNANPTSSDAVIAQEKTLIIMAEQLNTSNREALRTIAQMALAIKHSTTLDEVETTAIPHFKNPAMPSVSATADAALKIATARQGFANTDVFAEMIGFDIADIRRIKAQEQRAAGLAMLSGLESSIRDIEATGGDDT